MRPGILIFVFCHVHFGNNIVDKHIYYDICCMFDVRYFYLLLELLQLIFYVLRFGRLLFNKKFSRRRENFIRILGLFYGSCLGSDCRFIALIFSYWSVVQTFNFIACLVIFNTFFWWKLSRIFLHPHHYFHAHFLLLSILKYSKSTVCIFKFDDGS